MTAEVRSHRVCPKCKADTKLLGVSLSTEELDVIAVIVQCRRTPSHVYAFYYRLVETKPKWEEFLCVEAERTSGS